MRHQLRIGPKDGGTGFSWEVWALPYLKGHEANAVLESGDHTILSIAAEQGLDALKRAMKRPEGPARHEWECECGAQLSIEARRSKRSPYAWDSPRELVCICGNIFGVKLNFATGVPMPLVEVIARPPT